MTDLIENAQLVTRIFGEWPSFHDAEVTRIGLDRFGPDGATLEVQIHGFSTRSQVTADGHFVQENHTLVTMRFAGVAEVRIEGFNQQNVLFDLKISALDPVQHEGCRLAVEMTTSFGMSASFECVRGEVTDVRAYEPSA